MMTSTTATAARITKVIEALDVLEHNPCIGRPVAHRNRDLVIGRRSHGYIALYRYVEEIETIFVLAIRSQREAGFTGEADGGSLATDE